MNAIPSALGLAEAHRLAHRCCSASWPTRAAKATPVYALHRLGFFFRLDSLTPMQAGTGAFTHARGASPPITTGPPLSKERSNREERQHFNTSVMKNECTSKPMNRVPRFFAGKFSVSLACGGFKFLKVSPSVSSQRNRIREK